MKFAVALLCVSLAAVKDAVKGKTPPHHPTPATTPNTTRMRTVEGLSGVNKNRWRRSETQRQLKSWNRDADQVR